jgi:uncharacterized membrane protein YfcA
MRMLIFALVGAIAFMIAYAFGLGGTVSTIIFLFVLTNGVLDRWAQPILARLRPGD